MPSFSCQRRSLFRCGIIRFCRGWACPIKAGNDAACGIISSGGRHVRISRADGQHIRLPGQRDDSSGQAIKDLLEGDGFQVVRYEIVSDDKDTISAKLAEWADSDDVDLIVTTGGTGLGRYDVTPEACLAILDKQVPGMAEAMRAKTLEFTPMAMISRSVTGIRGNTLIITLPGSTKGVQECLAVVMPVIPHALELLHRETVSEHPR